MKRIGIVTILLIAVASIVILGVLTISAPSAKSALSEPKTAPIPLAEFPTDFHAIVSEDSTLTLHEGLPRIPLNTEDRWRSPGYNQQ